MPHSMFGWDYPAGVTDAMIDEHFGSDEHVSSACEQGLHEDKCSDVQCSCECHEGQTCCEGCGERVSNDLIVSSDERDMNDFNFLCSTCYRRLFGHREDEAQQNRWAEQEIEHEAARSEREQERELANYDGNEAMADAREQEDGPEGELWDVNVATAYGIAGTPAYIYTVTASTSEDAEHTALAMAERDNPGRISFVVWANLHDEPQDDEPELALPARCHACGWRGMAASSDCPSCAALALVSDMPETEPAIERTGAMSSTSTTYAVIAWYLNTPRATMRLGNRPCILYTSPRECVAERINQRLRRAARIHRASDSVLYFVHRLDVPAASEQCHTPQPSGWVQTYPEHSPMWCSDSPTCTCPRCRPHYDAGE